MYAPLDIQAFAKVLNELLVLASLRHGPRHGYQIGLDLKRQSDGLFVLTHGTLYPILHRLEADGAIRGTWSEDGGRRRKAYTLTRAGRGRLTTDATRCECVLEGVLRLAREEHGKPSETATARRRRA